MSVVTVMTLASASCEGAHPIHFAGLRKPCRPCVEAAAQAVDTEIRAAADADLVAVADTAGVLSDRRPKHRDDTRPVSQPRLADLVPFRLPMSRKGY